MTASSSPEKYLYGPATGDPQRGETKDDEEERVRRESIRRGQPLFDMVAGLVANGDGDALKLLYSGRTPLHEIIADDTDFRGDAGFAARAGAPFRPEEHAGVHAARALGGLGLALVAPEWAEKALSSALAWYSEARSSVAAPGWDPRDIARAEPRLLPLAEQLARVSGDERWAAGALTIAVTLGSLAAPGGKRVRRSGSTVLLAARTREDKEGVRGRLQMSVATGLPPGLAADPRRMALFAADPAFRESLDRAWAQAGAPRAGGTVLWSIEAAEGPVSYIEGESAGGAFAVVCDEVRRRSRPLAEARVVRRLQSGNAIVGQIDDDGYLHGVEGYESKLNALDNHAKVIVPTVDFQKAKKAAREEKGLQVVAAARWKDAARAARRPNAKVLLRQGLAVVLIAAVVVGLFAWRQEDNAAAQQRLAAAQQRARLSAQLTSTADNLRGSDPGLAAQFDAAAYQADSTPVAYTDLLNDESSPLDVYLPAGTGASASDPDSALAVSPAGNAVAVVSKSTVRLYDAADPARPPAAVGGPVSANALASPLAFSPDGRVLAAVGTGNVISLWNVADPAAPSKLSTLSGGGITALAFASKAPVLAVGTDDGDIQLWNVADPARPVPLGSLAGPVAQSSYDVLEPGGITSLTFAGTGAATLWAATSDGTIETWDAGDPARPSLTATPLPAGEGLGVDTSLSPAGEAVQTDSDGYTYADDLESYSTGAVTGSYASSNQLSTGDASPSVISPDGYTVATRDADGTITLVNRKALYSLGPPFPQNEDYSAGIPMNPLESTPGPMAFNTAGTVLAVDDDGNGIYLWHLPSGYTVDPNVTVGDVPPTGLTVSGAPADGTEKPLGSLPATAGTELAVSERGTVLVAAGANGSTTVWDVASPSRPRQLSKPFGANAIGAVLSADGTVLALLSGHEGTSQSLQLWSLTDPAHPERLGVPIAEPASQLVVAVAISPDDHTLALAGSSGEVDLIPLSPAPGSQYGEPLASNYDNQTVLGSGSGDIDYTGVYGLVYSPDGTTLSAVNGDLTARVWNLKPATVIAAVCAATGASLTAATWREYVSGAAFRSPCPADATAAGTAQPPAAVPSVQAAPPAICTAGDLALAMGPVETQGTTRLLVFTNVGHAACSVPGTPAVNLIGPSDAYGSILSLEPEAINQSNQPSAKNPVTLAPGGKAHMGAAFFFGIVPGQAPPPSRHPGYIYNWVPQQVQVVLPGSHATLTAPWGSGASVLQATPLREAANDYTPLMPGAA